MAVPAAPARKGVRWGLVLSVLAHLLLVAGFLAGPALPDLKPPEEEAVTVEMVPPPPEPEKKEEPKPDEKKPEETKPEQKQAEPPPPPTPRVAIRPTLSTAPEREDQVGQTRDADKTVETRPATPADQAETAAPKAADEPGEPDKAPGGAAAPKPATTEPPQVPHNPPAPSPAPPTTPNAAKADSAALAETPTSDQGEAQASLPPAEDGFTPALPEQDAPTPSARPAASGATAAAGAGGGGALKAAKTLNQAPMLKDPLARFALGQLPRKQQIQNLCAFEAVAQIRQARPDSDPEGIMTGPVSGNTLTAQGSFYKSRGKRYSIDFTCTVNLRNLTVTDFRYHLGSEIPAGAQKALEREGF